MLNEFNRINSLKARITRAHFEELNSILDDDQKIIFRSLLPRIMEPILSGGKKIIRHRRIEQILPSNDHK